MRHYLTIACVGSSIIETDPPFSYRTQPISGSHAAALEAFRSALESGSAPCIEEFLAQVGPEFRPELLRELLKLETSHRRESGQQPTREEYAGRFREFAGFLETIFPLVDATVSLPPADPFATQAMADGATAKGDAATDACGRFHIVKPHARGGLGEVFVARDDELHRSVALKRIRERFVDDAGSRARFLREAEITGNLEHPGIVPIYGLGADEAGRPYYAMRFIEGESLKETIDRFHQPAQPWKNAGERLIALRKLLQRFIDVCNAMEYAHSRGVIHRDLKPANIMVGKYGETLVVDWGLAKPLGATDDDAARTDSPLEISDAAGDSARTQMGQAVGTPQFMSPEQAAGRQDELAAATDIYALGAVLHSILSGRSPIAGKSLDEVLANVTAGKLAPLPSNAPAPLASICRKAMALKPADRYPSARALSDDVEKWLADARVAAHREGLGEQAARWARTHRAAVASAGALTLTALVALAIGLFVVRGEQRRTEEQKEVADANSVKALANADRAERKTKEAEEAAALARAEKERAEKEQRIAVAMRLAGESEALRATDPSRSLLRGLQAVRATTSIGAPPITAAENQLRASLVALKGQPLFGVRFKSVSPDGRWLIDVQQKVAFVWDAMASDISRSSRALKGHESDIYRTAISADSRWLVTGDSAKLLIWDLTTPGGTPRPKILVMDAYEFAISSNGRWLATNSDQSLKLWDLERPTNGKGMTPSLVIPCQGSCEPKISADSRWLAIRNNGAEIYDLTELSKKPIAIADMRPGEFSFDSSKLVLLGSQVINLLNLKAPDATPISLKTYQFWTERAILSDDNSRLVAFQYRGGMLLFDLSRPEEPPKQVAGHGDGNTVISEFVGHRYFATAGGDRKIRLWDFLQPNEPIVLSGHADDVTHIAMGRAGTQIVSRDSSDRARLWSLRGEGVEPRELTSGGQGSKLVFTSDGRNLIAGGREVYTLSGNRFSHESDETSHYSRHSSLSADESRIASISDKVVRVHDRMGAKIRWGRFQFDLVPKMEARDVALSPDGRWLAVCGDIYTEQNQIAQLMYWDLSLADPNKHRNGLSIKNDQFTAVAFSKDSRRLFFESSGAMLRVINLESPTKSVEDIRQANLFNLAKLAIGGEDRYLLALGFDDTNAYLWHMSALKEKPLVLKGHDSAINCMTTSSDGRYVVTGGRDATVRIWDTNSKNPAPGHRILAGHKGAVNSVAISADNRWVVSGSEDKTVRAWELLSKDDDAEPRVFTHAAPVTEVALDPKNRWIAAASNYGVELWRWRSEDLQKEAITVLEREGILAEMKMRTLIASQGAVGTWSPDGERVVFNTHNGQGLYVRELKTGETKLLVKNGKDSRWSPNDGRWIAFVRENAAAKNDKEEIWLVEAAGGEPRKVTNGGFPQWRDDGHTLSFRVNDGSNKIAEIDVRDPAAKPKIVVGNLKLSYFASLSPDGTKVAHEQDGNLIVRRVADNVFVAVVPIPGWTGLFPLWSRDSKRIVYGSYCIGGVEELWLLETETGRRARLAVGKYTMGEISPDGRRLLVDKRGDLSELWVADLTVEPALER